MRKGTRQARAVLLDVARRANDLFYAQARGRSGFSDKMPQAWQHYCQSRFRLNCENLLHVWNAYSALTGGGAAFGARRPAPAAPAQVGESSGVSGGASGSALGGAPALSAEERAGLAERGRRLMAHLEAQHDEMERLKRDVEARGPFAARPPGAPAPAAADLQLQQGADDEARGMARAEVISALILLQAHLEPTVERVRGAFR
jgi:hypothetical protein